MAAVIQQASDAFRVRLARPDGGIKKVMRFVVPTATVICLIWWVNWAEVLPAVRQCSLLWLIGFLVLSSAMLFSHVVRVSVIFKVSLRYAFRVIFSFAWMRIWAPDVVVQGGRWFMLTRKTGSRSRVFGGLVYSELVGITVRIGALIILLIPTWSIPIACATVLLAMLFRNALRRLTPSWLAYYLHANIRLHVYCVIINVVQVILASTIWFSAIRAAHASVPFWSCTLGQLLCWAGSKFPFTVGAIGVQEGIVAWLTHTHGIPSETAFVVMVILNTAWLLTALGAVVTFIRTESNESPSDQL